MNIILVAAPAAGKGTVAELLHQKYGYIGVSAGELLRGVDPETEMGKYIRKTQSEGKLVSNEITNELMKQRLSKDDTKNGVILDGYPRVMDQVYALEGMMKELNFNVDYVVYLKVDYETACKRTLGRRICPKCKKTYNVLTGYSTPKVENTCDDCGCPLDKRNDDNEESLKVRFDFFKENTLPVVEYYRNLGKLVEIDSSKDIEVVMKDLEKSLGV
jgi:adenylate kinase